MKWQTTGRTNAKIVSSQRHITSAITNCWVSAHVVGKRKSGDERDKIFPCKGGVGNEKRCMPSTRLWLFLLSSRKRRTIIASSIGRLKSRSWEKLPWCVWKVYSWGGGGGDRIDSSSMANAYITYEAGGGGKHVRCNCRQLHLGSWNGGTSGVCRWNFPRGAWW